MSLNERERIHHQLLDALYTAKKQVEYLEAALAHNAAYLGTGVEREGKFGVRPEDMVAPHALIRYLELVEPEADISDYIGSEGVDRTRPRLGPDAPASIRPNKQPAVDPQVVEVARAHPDDFLAFSFRGNALPPGTYLHTEDHGESGNEAEEGAVESMGPGATVPVPSGDFFPPLSGKELAAGLTDVGPGNSPASPLPVLVENVPTPGSPASPGASVFPARTPPAPPAAQDAAPDHSAAGLPFSAKDGSAGVACRPVTDEDCLRAHNAIQALNYGIWDWNMRTGNVFISSRWQEIMGSPPPNLPSAIDTLIRRLHPEDGSRLRDSLVNLQNGPATSFSMPVRYARKGEAAAEFSASGHIHAIYQRVGGKAVRLTAVLAEDVQTGPGAQEVHRNEARLAALYRLSRMDDYSEDRMVRYCLGEAVRLTGSEFGYVYVSPGPEEREGHIYWSSDLPAGAGKEAAGIDFCAPSRAGRPECFLPHGPEVVNALEDVMARAFGGAVAVSRYMLIPIMEDGRVLCVAAVANKKSNYEASDQRQLDLFINGMWFHLRRRRAVGELLRAKEAAEAASRAKNEFLANISHELRTPLNGMLGMLQVLQQSELTGEQAECVTTALGSGRSLLRIISDILDFARMEGGDLELIPHVFDFPAMVRSVMGLFSYEAERRGLAFQYSVSEAIPRFLVGDESRVRQIFFNLVGNAVKFTAQGEVSVECELLPYKKNGKPCVYIAVHDSGIGISQEKVNLIFQAFTQIDGSSTRRYSGAGIGLAIVGRLVQLMDGALTVESEPGLGTTVHCSLPFEEAPAGRTEAETPPPRRAQPLEILAVEDDPVNRFTLLTLLKKAGHTAVCVPDGRQALEALLLRPFQCVITDIQMPVMDGSEFVRRIREGRTEDIEPGAGIFDLLGMDKNVPVKKLSIPRDIPIVALTAHALAGDRERFLAMGLDYYLAKPLAASELAAVLSRISDLVNAGQQQK